MVDILSNPPREGKYDVIKNALLNRLTDSEDLRLKKLLTELDLGEKCRFVTAEEESRW